MADIVLRTATKDFVCCCCGKLIKKGTPYLDKVILHTGQVVRHDRYHDECPVTPDLQKLAKLLNETDEFIVIMHNEKWRVKALQFLPERRVVLSNWSNSAQTEVTLEFFLGQCLTSQGNYVRSLL